MGQARRWSLGKVGRLLYVMVPANDRAVKSERVKSLATTPMGIDEHRRHLHNTLTHAHRALPYIRVTLRLWHMWHASLNWVRSIAFPASQTICQSTELTYCQSIVHMQRLDAKETKPSRDQTRPRKVATRYRWRSATHTHHCTWYSWWADDVGLRLPVWQLDRVDLGQSRIDLEWNRVERKVLLGSLEAIHKS